MSLLSSSTPAEELLLDAELLLDERRIAAALVRFDAAESAGAMSDRCCAGRWMCYMLAGDFASAWGESDKIREHGAPDPYRFWTGEDLRGRRVIVRCLHGLGDAVQMLRYAPRLKELCAELTVEVPPALFEIAARFKGVEHAIPWGPGAPGKSLAWDLQIEVTELPYLFRTTVHDLPIAERYLVLEEERCPAELGKTGEIPRIGVAWAAGEWNPNRSIPFAEFSRLLGVPRAEFWNLQGGARATDWNSLPNKPELRDARELGDGVGLLARVISHMDLVITVDTLAAHLAGALGVPAWLLLQSTADWRWMLNTSASPWYPSLRIYRCSGRQDWGGLVRHVEGDLQGWLAEFSREAASRMGQ